MGIKGATKRSQVHPGQQQVWQAMRIMRRFTHVDLQITCPLLGAEASRHYVSRLRHCGYIQRVALRRPGQPGSRDTFALVRDTGPVAPVLRHASCSVLDVNTGKAWGKGGVELPVTPAARVRPLTRPMRLALAALLAGRPATDALTDPGNAGCLAVLLGSLRKRDLVDATGALTDLGRAVAGTCTEGQP